MAHLGTNFGAFSKPWRLLGSTLWLLVEAPGQGRIWSGNLEYIWEAQKSRTLPGGGDALVPGPHYNKSSLADSIPQDRNCNIAEDQLC